MAAARLRRYAAPVLRHARRVDRPRRASAQPRGPVPVYALERGAQAPERARDAAQARSELPGRGRVSVVRVRAHGVRGRDRLPERATRPAGRDQPTRSTRTAAGASISSSRSRTTRSGSGGTAGYLALINTLGRSMLYPTGSRAMKRQSGGRAAGNRDIAELRAIPNNAILHQLGYLVNSFAGLGHATEQSPETFLAVLDGSERLERVLSLALTARERSDVTMFEAYVQLMNANYWLDRTSQSLDRGWNRVLRRMSQVLEDAFDYDAMARFVRRCAAMRPSSTTCSSSVNRGRLVVGGCAHAAAHAAARVDPLDLPEGDGDPAVQLAARDPLGGAHRAAPLSRRAGDGGDAAPDLSGGRAGRRHGGLRGARHVRRKSPRATRRSTRRFSIRSSGPTRSRSSSAR